PGLRARASLKPDVDLLPVAIVVGQSRAFAPGPRAKLSSPLGKDVGTGLRSRASRMIRITAPLLGRPSVASERGRGAGPQTVKDGRLDVDEALLRGPQGP